ncbi:hypothetical protein JCM1393_01810 [Clostridium carnis]
MNIKGIGYVRSAEYYNKMSSNKVNKVDKKIQVDRIELSKEAKALKDYSIDKNIYDNKAKVEEIRNKISTGTYSYNSKLIAKGMVDSMRGRD